MAKRKKILFFYNPNSGNGLFTKNLDKIIGMIQDEGYQVVPVRAGKGSPIDQALSEIDEEMYRQVIVAGGDGTINICVNSMINHGINLPLAILPAGTANDFANYLEIPQNIDDMMKVALGNSFTNADVGECNGKYFVNVAAIGNLVDVSQKTDPNLKNTIGIFAYYLKGFSEMANLKAVPVKVTTSDNTYEENIFFMIVMNGSSAGGFKHLSPNAQINDGYFEVMMFKKMPILELVPVFFDVIRGSHIENKNVISFKTSKLLVESEKEMGTDVDGEKGSTLPLSFNILPNRLKIYTMKRDIC